MATNKRRLIDVNALPVAKVHIVDEAGFGADFYVVYEEDIRKAPTVDAVEVVRCKDCKHYVETDLWCNLNCCVGDSHANWYPEDFCSYGERKDNGKE